MLASTFAGNPVVPEGHSYLNSTFFFSIKFSKAQFFFPQPSDPLCSIIPFSFSISYNLPFTFIGFTSLPA